MPGRGELIPMSPEQKKKLKELAEKNRKEKLKDLKKPLLTGNQKEIDMNNNKVIDGEDLAMLRAKMAMPKMVDSSNFPKMAQDMAMAMDYNSSKPRMDHGKTKMYKPKAYHDKK